MTSALYYIGNKISAFVKWLFADQQPQEPVISLYEQQNINNAGRFIEKLIRSCDNPRYLDSIARMATNMPIIYGKKSIVTDWVQALELKITLKRQQFSNQ